MRRSLGAALLAAGALVGGVVAAGAVQAGGADGSAASVALAVTDSPDPVARGAELTYTVTATNTGGDLDKLAVELAMDADVPVESAATSAGWCAAPHGAPNWSSPAHRVRCTAGPVAAGGQVVVRVTVPPSRTGKVTASVTALAGDEGTEVAAASQSTTVVEGTPGTAPVEATAYHMGVVAVVGSPFRCGFPPPSIDVECLTPQIPSPLFAGPSTVANARLTTAGGAPVRARPVLFVMEDGAGAVHPLCSAFTDLEGWARCGDVFARPERVVKVTFAGDATYAPATSGPARPWAHVTACPGGCVSVRTLS